MRASTAQFELFDPARVPVGGWSVGNAAGIEDARRAGKYKNRGNEAKKYLKTKDIIFLNAAKCARFACYLAQIAHRKQQVRGDLKRETGGLSDWAPRGNPKAASGRRTPRRPRHEGFGPRARRLRHASH